MSLLSNFTKNHYPALALIVWFGSLTILYAPLPEILVWFYVLFFPVLMVYDLFQRYRQRALKLRIGFIDIIVFTYNGYVLYSLFTNPELPLSNSSYLTEFLFRTFTPFTIYWFVRVNPLDFSNKNLFTNFLAFIIVFETIMGFISLFFPLILPEFYRPREAHLFTRATGTFVTPSAYVLTLMFCMVFVFDKLRKLEASLERTILIGILNIGIIGVLISQNRSGWLILPIIVAILIYLEPQLSRWLIGTIAGVALLIVLIHPNFLGQSLYRLRETRQVDSRITMGMAGLEMFLANPVSGWGYASYDLHDWRFMRTIGTIEPTRYELSRATSHNTYLTMLAETGLIGFSLYMLPTLYWFLRTLYIRIRQRQHYNWEFILLMWLTVLIVNLAAQFADLRFFPFVVAYWWLALAMIANELLSPRAIALESVENRDRDE